MSEWTNVAGRARAHAPPRAHRAPQVLGICGDLSAPVLCAGGAAMSLLAGLAADGWIGWWAALSPGIAALCALLYVQLMIAVRFLGQPSRRAHVKLTAWPALCFSLLLATLCMLGAGLERGELSAANCLAPVWTALALSLTFEIS